MSLLLDANVEYSPGSTTGGGAFQRVDSACTLLPRPGTSLSRRRTSSCRSCRAPCASVTCWLPPRLRYGEQAAGVTRPRHPANQTALVALALLGVEASPWALPTLRMHRPARLRPHQSTSSAWTSPRLCSSGRSRTKSVAIELDRVPSLQSSKTFDARCLLI